MSNAAVIASYVNRLFEYKTPFNFDDIRQVETALRQTGVGQGKDFWQTLQAVNAAVKYNAQRTGRNGFSLPNGTGMARYLPMDAMLLVMTARAQSGYDKVRAIVDTPLVQEHYNNFTTTMVSQYFDNCDGTGHIRQPISQRCRQIKSYLDSLSMNYFQIARRVWTFLCDQLETHELADMPSVAHADYVMLSSPKFLFMLTLIEAEAMRTARWTTDTVYLSIRTVMDQQESEIDGLIDEIVQLENERRAKK